MIAGHLVLLVAGEIFPPTVVQGVEMEDVGLAVAGDEVEAAGDAHGALVEVDGEDFVLNLNPAIGV
jgi:hypothetical protein